MKKPKIITVDFPRKNQPAADWWFPEESLVRLEEILMEENRHLVSDLEVEGRTMLEMRKKISNYRVGGPNETEKG